MRYDIKKLRKFVKNEEFRIVSSRLATLELILFTLEEKQKSSPEDTDLPGLIEEGRELRDATKARLEALIERLENDVP